MADSWKLANGQIVTTWGDFRRHVISVGETVQIREELQAIAARFKRQGKTPADLCEAMHNIATYGRVTA